MNVADKPHLVLASSSPRRRKLISSLGFDTTWLSSDVDESYDPHWTPKHIVRELSSRKARAAAWNLTQSKSIVIGSDTIVVLKDWIMGKPHSVHEAKEMLQALQGTAHQVHTGIACIDMSSGRELVDSRVTTVHMKPMSEAQIAAYIATEEPMDKAGAYAIQGIGATLIDSIEGDYFNVVGLSLSLLSDMLLTFGLDVLQDNKN